MISEIIIEFWITTHFNNTNRRHGRERKIMSVTDDGPGCIIAAVTGGKI